MSKRCKTPTFVIDLPLRVDPSTDRTLMVRFDAARQLYNACLGEALRRFERMCESEVWQKAKQIPKDKKKERRDAFNEAKKVFGFTDYSIGSYSIACKNACWISHHLDTGVTQKVAWRAFYAVEQYSFGKRGRPRFKSRFKTLRSVEGKSNESGIRWRNDHVEWKGLILRPIFDRKDKHGVQSFALQCRVKYVQLIWRQLRCKRRWYVQLVLEGHPKWKDKNPVSDDVVGLDIGPSTIAAVGEREALLERFCPSVKFPRKKIRRIKRAMDRSLRANNPDNFNHDGTFKKGSKRWVYSKGYLRLLSRLQELLRRLNETRKTEHGMLANRIIAIAKHIQTEKISYLAFQKQYGRSVRDRAPGKFVDLLKRKVPSVGGKFVEFSTYTTCLSQVCHNCGSKQKKTLSQRIHVCECGVVMQRDLYSAFLARCVEGDTLNVVLAAERWPGAEPFLLEAWRRAANNVKCKAPSTFGTFPRRSRLSEESEASITLLDGKESTVVPSRTSQS